MATIEERANKFALEKHPYSPFYEEYAKMYIEIATEQKAIDDAKLEKIVSSWKEEEEYWIKRNKKLIDKACEWLKNVFEGGGYFQEWQLEDFRKAMEEE